jgi:hypothetical protein
MQKISGITIKKYALAHIIIIVPLFVTLLLLFFQGFRQNSHLNIAIPVSIPEKAYYVKNIKQYKQEPINYVMQLFDKYDIVVLCERMHPEYTQWEFFSKIVLNDTFATKVKNVFTETGDAHNQELLDSYMQTHFSTLEDLQRVTAQIVRENGVWPVWNNANIYDFILNLHQFNESKDKINQINLFFTDKTINWDSIKNSVEYNNVLFHTNRDSIMAYNILNQYETSHLNKSLVIVNTRHAWNYGHEEKETNEVTYIFDKFPDKTAVVLINGTTQIMLPMMNGTLDEAAIEIPDSIWAVDFEKCSLGNTPFDLTPIKRNKCTYKDLFVGMVYYKHPSDWKMVYNYPFILNDYKDTLLKRSTLVGENYRKRMNEAIEKDYFNTIHKEETPYPKLFNFGFLVLHCMILIFLSINFFHYLLKNKRKTMP